MLEGWADSPGARIERDFACRLGLVVIYENVQEQSKINIMHINHSSEAIEVSLEVIEKLSKMPIPCLPYNKAELMISKQAHIEFGRGHSKVMLSEELNKKINVNQKTTSKKI